MTHHTEEPWGSKCRICKRDATRVIKRLPYCDDHDDKSKQHKGGRSSVFIGRSLVQRAVDLLKGKERDALLRLSGGACEY